MLDAEFLSTLGHPVRLQALVMFEDAPASAGELARVVGMTPSATLHHIRRLESIGLIEEHEIRRRRAFEERVWRTTTHGWAELEAQLRAAAPPHDE
jgi:DNA-binding transcriptional ArsR family regulator